MKNLQIVLEIIEILVTMGKAKFKKLLPLALKVFT